MKMPKLRTTKMQLDSASKVQHSFHLKFTLLSRDGCQGVKRITPAATGKVHWQVKPRRPIGRVLVERYDDDCAMEHCWLTAEQWQKLNTSATMHLFCRPVFEGSELIAALKLAEVTPKYIGDGGGEFEGVDRPFNPFL